MTGKRKLTGVVWLLAALGVLILVGALAPKRERPERPAAAAEKKPASTEIEAFVFSQTFVKRKLKTPSTAKFPSYREATVSSTGSDAWRVEAWVDAQNMFGAMVRNPYTCELHKREETWYLDDLQLTNVY